MENVVIKEAKSNKDIELILDIYRSDMGKYGTNHTEKDIKTIRNILEREFEELGNNRIIFLAFKKERVIGTIQLLLKEADNDPELADGSLVAHAHHLRVAYDLHKKGIGKMLTLKVEEVARLKGFKKVTLGVDDWNLNAVDFYKHLGYKFLKEKESRNKDEKLIYMYKEIQ